ncbi:MAG TPA: DUF2244 domain-containing protein [Aliidongia sp.]|uniref:DUF2244 domain-containing protein n=1 Tax=Aliidongia sp. TaxID=1914230 RepID=UPI002DDCF3F0|nr:DUF2244 domain-containing protein [Aliidongia sp.]HEV2678250.1 DUF2244 domain-containing protein [Aliidongia sp.]
MSEPASSPDPTPRYEAVLRPHRSLPPRGFFFFMLAVAGVSFVTGVGFVMMGAWPVTGFFGLDVLLLYGAFRLSYRSGRMRETIRLAGDDVTVERVSVRGEIRTWRFQAFWLRIRMIELGNRGNRLLLASHGRELAVAGFLTPEERRALAADLDAALVRYRNPSTSFMP